VARLLSAILLSVCVAAMPAFAADTEDAPRYTRSDTLEIPGLTAGCHICEWRPKLNHMPAAEQCGTDDAGSALAGLFECGFAPDCQRECHFIRCGTQ
jgi:hypothetical protein